MSYHDDELAPPNGDFPDALIRAASLSALLLTACSDPKPATPSTSATTELVRPAASTPEFEFIQPPASAPRVAPPPRIASKATASSTRTGPKHSRLATLPAASAAIGAWTVQAQASDREPAEEASSPIAATTQVVTPQAASHTETVAEDVQTATATELAVNSPTELDNPPLAAAVALVNSAAPESEMALDVITPAVEHLADLPVEQPVLGATPADSESVAPTNVAVIEAEIAAVPPVSIAASMADEIERVEQSPAVTQTAPQTTIEPTFAEQGPSSSQDGSDLQTESTTLNSATALPETIQASAELSSAPAAESAVAVTPAEEPPPEYVYEIIETTPTAAVRTLPPETTETLSAVTDVNGTLHLTRVTEAASEPTIAPAQPVTPPPAAVEPEQAISPLELLTATNAPAPAAVEPLTDNIQPVQKKDPVEKPPVQSIESVAIPKTQLVPQRTAALATNKVKRKLAVVPKELSRPPVAKEHSNAQVELLQPVPNKVIVQALTAAIAAAAQQDNAYQPEPPPSVEDADDAEWEARMQTSQAPTSIIEMPARAPRNLTGSDFVENGAKDVTGNSVTLSIAALGDAPINGYFVAESIGSSKPKTPKSSDPNWQEIEPVSVYGTEQTYTLKQSYADSTPVNLHVWFKDTTGQVSPAVHSKIALHRADTVISDDAPYVVDAALGFKDWIYQRGASQMGSAPHGRAKARADADNYLLSPPLTLPQTKNDATLILALRQWYQFGADANVSDGARATLEIAIEQLPGQWSDWANLTDGDKSTSPEWTAPRFDLSTYAGSTVKFRVGVAGSLHALADWGLSELSIAPEKPIQILPQSAYAQGFEADWNGWSSRLPQWSLTGPSLDGKILAPEGLYHAAAKPIGLGTGEFTLNSPMFQLPTGSVDMSFSEWHSLGHGEGRLQVSYFDANTGWRPWQDLGRAITGRSAAWQTLQADLSPYAGKKIRVRILARLTPSDSVMRIDEFLVVAH